MRRQEGSEGCRIAHVRDVISGWAGEVMGEMLLRDCGREGLLGKRIGDTKGLVWMLVYLI